MTSTAAEMQDSAPRYAPEDLTLPKPWKGLVAGNMGYLYYWNPVTNVTQYERPVADDQLPPPPPLPKSIPLSSVQVNQHHRDEEGRSRNLQEGARVSSACLATSDVRHVSSSGHNRSSSVHGAHSSSLLRTSIRNHVSSNSEVHLSSEAYCHQHEITVTGEDIPAPYTTFESTGFPVEVLKEVHRAGFSFPTPIQAQSWPIALQNRDLVAIAKTGSGKTIGYLFPGFMHIKRLLNNSKVGPTMLVLSPTRELATQIQDEAVKFGSSSNISCTCLYGGAPKSSQLRDLEHGVDIVVATPGRLNDILEMRRISLRQVSYLVLDEADRMLDMGFEPQIRRIVKEVPHLRQTLMFTATWPKEVRKIAADLLVSPVQVNIGNINELVANKSITQHVELIKPVEKQRRLEQILRSQETGSKVIIFCTTKRMCDQLTRSLVCRFGVASIHGDKSQVERDRVLGQFKTGRSPILVATDVAARGLDIKDIRAVINYDFPTGVEDYVHRIGRTGRAGATGVSYTFFSDHDSKYALELIKVLEGADQKVPPDLRDMAACSGYGGKSRRWGLGSVARDNGRLWAGRNDSNNIGRSGHLAPSTRVNHISCISGREHDNSDDYRRSAGHAFKRHADMDARHTLRGRSHSRSYSPNPRKGRDALRNGQNRCHSKSWDKTHSSRSRSKSWDKTRKSGSRSPSRSLEFSNGRSPERIALSKRGSSPFKRKNSFNDCHRESLSPPRKRRESLKDGHRRPSPHLMREKSVDRLRSFALSRKMWIDQHYRPSQTLKRENFNNGCRRLSPAASSRRDNWKPVLHDRTLSFSQPLDETECDRPIHKCQNDGIESGKPTNGPTQISFAFKNTEEEEEGLIPLDEDESLIPPELIAASPDFGPDSGDS